MATSITDLIRGVGEENVVVQFIDQSISDIQTVRGGNKLTFYTNAVSPGDYLNGATGKVGIVLWVDRDRVKKILPNI